MIMQQTLFIVILAVVIVFALAYRWKKKAENKMGNDLNALIEANDWRECVGILRKQLIVWGLVLVLCIGLLVARIMSGGQFLYTYNCLCFLGMEILQVGKPLHDFVQEHESSGGRE